MSKKLITALLGAIVSVTILFPTVFAAEEMALPQTLIKNVHVWDGTSDGVTKKINVLVEGKLIKKLRAGDGDANAAIERHLVNVRNVPFAVFVNEVVA